MVWAPTDLWCCSSTEEDQWDQCVEFPHGFPLLCFFFFFWSPTAPLRTFEGSVCDTALTQQRQGQRGGPVVGRMLWNNENTHSEQTLWSEQTTPRPLLQGLDFWSYLLFIFYVLFSDDYGIFSDKLLFVLLSEVQDCHFFPACYIVATVWVKLSFFRDISVVTRPRHVLLALSCRKNVVNVISSPCSTTQQAPLPVLLRYCNKGLSHVTVWDQLRPVFYITTRWRYSVKVI